MRHATAADAPALAALSTELGYPVDGAAIAARLAVLSKRDDQAVYVTCDPAGGVTGWVHVAEQTLLETGLRCEILGLIVSSRCRRQGLGQRLADAAERWAAVRGLREISVRSNVVRVESHPFYVKRGYTRVKTQHAYRKRLDPGASS